MCLVCEEEDLDEGPEPVLPREEAENAADVPLPAQSPIPDDQQDLQEVIVHADENIPPNPPPTPPRPADASARPTTTLLRTPTGLPPTTQPGRENDHDSEDSPFFTPTFRSTGHPSDVTTITPGYKYRNQAYSASSSSRGTIRQRSPESPGEKTSRASRSHIPTSQQGSTSNLKSTHNREPKRRRKNEWTWYKTENGMRREDDRGEGSSKGKKRMN